MVSIYDARRVTADEANALLDALSVRLRDQEIVAALERPEVDDIIRQVELAQRTPTSLPFRVIGQVALPSPIINIVRWLAPRRTEFGDFIEQLRRRGVGIDPKRDVMYIGRWDQLRWVLTGRA